MNSSSTTQPLKVPASGSLAEWNVRKLYAFLAVNDASGALVVSANGVDLTLLFKRGTLHGLESSSPADSIFTFVSHCLGNEEKKATLKAELPKFGDDALATAFSLGLLNPNAVLPQLSMRALTLLSRLFGLTTGLFRFDSMGATANHTFPLGTKWGTYIEALRRAASADVKKLMHDVADFAIAKSEGLVALSDLKLNPKEGLFARQNLHALWRPRSRIDVSR